MAITITKTTKATEQKADFAAIKEQILASAAEATAEKRALAFYADGRVSAIFGTHTHTQTADEQILPGGTGYITDLGMVGAEQSVLGVKPEIMVERFRTHLPARFEPAEGSPFLCGCLFDIDEKTGACTAVERICLR